MARKAKQFSQTIVTNTVAHKDPQDDDIPEKLCRLASRFRRRTRVSVRGANHGGLVKSWKLSSKSCNRTEKSPFLPQFNHNSEDIDPYNYGFLNNYWYRTVDHCCIEIPNLGTNTPFKHMVLFNDSDNSVKIGVTGVSRPLFMFYKKTCQWVKYNHTLINPNSTSQQYMQLVNIVGLNGKLYALSLQGTLVVIEEVDSSMTITIVSSSRAIPSVFCRHFREYLVESAGEIYLIFLLSMRSTSVVDKVEIFRLQMESIAWKSVQKLGKESALFVGARSCFMVNASEVGCKGNCVYITNREVKGWWVYDVARDNISPCSNYSTLFDLRASIWKSIKVV